MKLNYLFLSVGKTGESKEAAEFKRYIGYGSTHVVAVNPKKAELDNLMGYDSQSDPEYIGSDDNGKWARVTFIVKTDPETNNGIEITSRLSFTLYNTPAYSKDNTKVQVIDDYGNSTWATVEDVKAGNKLMSSNGKELKIANKYRMACRGEADLVAFLKTYLCVDDAFNYVNGTWTLKDNADDYKFALEHISDYFKGDFSEVKEAIALQPNNKIKLLYGVHTTDEGKQYQTIATKDRLILRNSAGSKAFEKAEKELVNIKQGGGYATTEFKVQELAEYDVQATDLNNIPADTTNTGSEDEDLPWS
jgi:hypothetical protein